MNSINVLITGIGGDIGQGVLKCLQEASFPLSLIGCDMDAFAGGRNLVKVFRQAPAVKMTEMYSSFLNDLIKQERVTYVIPTSEAEISFIGENRSRFPEDVVFLINENSVVRQFLDKYETTLFLKEQGLAYPKTYLLEDYCGELSFPVLLKPRRGCGGKGIVLVHTQEEFDFYKKQSKALVVQEFINSDDEYTITVFSDGDKFYHIGFKRSLGYGSLSKIAHLVDDPAIKELAEKIVQGIRLKGSLNIQCKKTAKGYVPFEINPRFSSTVYTRHYFGFTDVLWWIEQKEGRNFTYSQKYKKGVAVRVLGETFFDMVVS